MHVLFTALLAVSPAPKIIVIPSERMSEKRVIKASSLYSPILNFTQLVSLMQQNLKTYKLKLQGRVIDIFFSKFWGMCHKG